MKERRRQYFEEAAGQCHCLRQGCGDQGENDSLAQPQVDPAGELNAFPVLELDQN